jgi:hypothetical protein
MKNDEGRRYSAPAKVDYRPEEVSTVDNGAAVLVNADDLVDLLGPEEPTGNRAPLGRLWEAAGDVGRLGRYAEPGSSLQHLADRLACHVLTLDAMLRPTAADLVRAGFEVDQALEHVDRHVARLHSRMGGRP